MRHPQMGVVMVTWRSASRGFVRDGRATCLILAPIIFLIGEAKHFKCRVQIDTEEY